MNDHENRNSADTQSWKKSKYTGSNRDSGNMDRITVGSIIFIVLCIVIPPIVVVTVFAGVALATPVADLFYPVEYNEEILDEYAREQYEEKFGGSAACEDGILVVILTTRTEEEIYYACHMGDHIAPEVKELFKEEGGSSIRLKLEENVKTGILKHYWQDLDSQLAEVVSGMEYDIKWLDIEDNFTCNDEHGDVRSELTNYTHFDVSPSDARRSLLDFTKETGISLCIVVEEAEDVMPSHTLWMIPGAVAAAVVGGVTAVVIVKKAKKKRLARADM